MASLRGWSVACPGLGASSVAGVASLRGLGVASLRGLGASRVAGASNRQQSAASACAASACGIQRKPPSEGGAWPPSEEGQHAQGRQKGEHNGVQQDDGRKCEEKGKGGQGQGHVKGKGM